MKKTLKDIIDSVSLDVLEKAVANSCSYAGVLREIGIEKIPGSQIYDYFKKRLQELNIDVSHFTGRAVGNVIRTFDNTFCKDSTVDQDTLRKHYRKLENIPYECVSCGNIGKWNDKELHLQLEHKNGDKHDNRLENLCWLCPTCHSQTDTFCGRNHSKDTTEKHHCPACNVIVKRVNAKRGLCYNCERKITFIKQDHPVITVLSDKEIASIADEYQMSSEYLRYVFQNKQNNEIRVRIKQATSRQKQNQKRKICPKCGGAMSNRAKQCLACHKKEYVKTSDLSVPASALDVITRILDSSFVAVAREYAVSDNAIRKRLRAAGLPTKRNELYRWYESQTGHKHSREDKKRS